MRDNSLYVTSTPFPPVPPQQREFAEVATATNFAEYWRILRQHRRTALLTLCVCIFLGVLSVIKSEPLYTTTAVIRIQNQAPNITGVADTFRTEGGQGE